MRIDRKLNFVIPIYGDEKIKTDAEGQPIKGDDGKPVMFQPVIAYVHSTPLAAETVDKHFLILGQTFSSIFNNGLGTAAGPGMAMRLLKSLAIRTRQWEDSPDGEQGVRTGLVEEIRRLTMVIVPGASGWQPIPLQVAVDRKILIEEDRSEVENAIVFFIAVSATLNRAERKPMLETACGLWSALLSQSNPTDFAASLTTSTETASSGEKSHATVTVTSPAANATVDGKPSSVPA
jgi:hypothetical protein